MVNRIISRIVLIAIFLSSSFTVLASNENTKDPTLLEFLAEMDKDLSSCRVPFAKYYFNKVYVSPEYFKYSNSKFPPLHVDLDELSKRLQEWYFQEQGKLYSLMGIKLTNQRLSAEDQYRAYWHPKEAPIEFNRQRFPNFETARFSNIWVDVRKNIEKNDITAEKRQFLHYLREYECFLEKCADDGFERNKKTDKITDNEVTAQLKPIEPEFERYWGTLTAVVKNLIFLEFIGRINAGYSSVLGYFFNKHIQLPYGITVGYPGVADNDSRLFDDVTPENIFYEARIENSEDYKKDKVIEFDVIFFNIHGNQIGSDHQKIILPKESSTMRSILYGGEIHQAKTKEFGSMEIRNISIDGKTVDTTPFFKDGLTNY